MLGAIIGDIVGSPYEFLNIKTKDFPLISNKCTYTDDTVMTIAVLKTLKQCGRHCSDKDFQKKLIYNMQDFGRRYRATYGIRFQGWLESSNPKPYDSCGNGAAMRISPVGFFAESEEEVIKYSKLITEVSHNHPEAIKGAEAIALSVYMAKRKMKKEDILVRMISYYPELIDLDYKYYKSFYGWEYGEGSGVCQGSVPEAIACFYASEDFEDAIRNAISIGGDSDTIGAMVGGIAGAFYEISPFLKSFAKDIIPNEFLSILYDEWVE